MMGQWLGCPGVKRLVPHRESSDPRVGRARRKGSSSIV